MRLLDAGRALGARRDALSPRRRRQRSSRESRRDAGSPARRSRTRWAPWAIAAAAAIVAAVSLALARPQTRDAAIPGWGATEVVTGATELATVQLGEGSVVRLAPSSRLRVLAGRERAVNLEGRAFFAVERMPRHPLRVHTPPGRRVLGTRFELATNADRLELRVVEGRVALEHAARSDRSRRRRGERRPRRCRRTPDPRRDTSSGRDVGRDVPRVSGDAVARGRARDRARLRTRR